MVLGVIHKPRGQDEVGGQSNVHECPRKVGKWFAKCPRGQNIRKAEETNFFIRLSYEKIMTKCLHISRPLPKYKLKIFRLVNSMNVHMAGNR